MRYSLVSTLLVTGLGFAPLSDGFQVPNVPTLLGVSLVGSRVCGPLTVGSLPSQKRSFRFDCRDTLQSGWRLTPATIPTSTNPPRTRLNRNAVIRLRTPTLTELDFWLELPRDHEQRALKAVNPRVPGKPGEVFFTQEVGVTKVDDAYIKTWAVEVIVSGCADVRHLRIFARTRTGARSGPLNVYLLRHPDEKQCFTGGGAAYGITGEVSGPGDPPTAGCTPRLFHVCESCSIGNEPELNVYVGYTACSWNEVMAVFTRPTCRIKQVSGREACEVP
jgi:hypothetical protein